MRLRDESSFLIIYRTAFESAKKGDKTAKKVVETYVSYLGDSVLSMLNIFRPEAFIIGGLCT